MSDDRREVVGFSPGFLRVVVRDVLAVVQRALDVCYFRRRDDGPGAISNFRGLADAVAALPEAKL
jgi:hypothetical protein